MTRKCELCPAHSQAAGPQPVKWRRVWVEDRQLAVCELHAAQVRQQAPATLAELRQAFPEQPGQRSLLERRASLDRRVFPARPEGRRGGGERRTSDRSR